jgi:hypothetical protein
MEDFFSLF